MESSLLSDSRINAGTSSLNTSEDEATVEESTRMDARMDGGGQARLLGTFDERPEYKQLDELVRARQKEAPPASGRIGRR